ncbi:MAG: phenylalanine--tRNA ligase subunit beta, partial [Oscillospiraceae bacterium]|nr:phenylalanine--tRNA ligase subunit beta [Oscillospiraceae bacterium]
TVTVDGRQIATMGELLPSVAANFDIRERVNVAMIDVEALYAVRGGERKFSPLPKVPALTRDLAHVCDAALPSAALEKEIRTACGELLESVTVFDVYTGDKVAAGKKSIAYSLVLRHGDRTLTDAEADAAIKRALARLEHIGAVLRS